MKFLFFIAAVCISILFLKENAMAQDVYECVFLDAQTGERLNGVELTLFLPGKKGSKTFYSDQDGAINFDIVAPLVPGQSYNISFSKDGYVSPSGYLRLVQPFSRKYQIHKLPDNVPVANVIKSVDEQTVTAIEPISYIVSNDLSLQKELVEPKILDGFAYNNFVFLIDESNSMNQENRIEMLKESLAYLVENFRKSDQVAVVAYSSAARLVLNSTRAEENDLIIDAINKLNARGGTSSGVGLELAYEIAQKNFLKDGSNKIILATDGAFASTNKELRKIKSMIKSHANNEINLSVLSFGKVSSELANNMQEMSSAGNGNYAHASSIEEARDVLIKEAQGKRLK